MSNGGALKRWGWGGWLCLGIVACEPTVAPKIPVDRTDVEGPASAEPGAPPSGGDASQGPRDDPSAPPPEDEPEKPPRPVLCAPTGAGPYWLQEGEAVSATVRCGTGYTAPELRFAVSPLPAGASFNEETGTLTWTPVRGQADVWRLTVTERSTGETGELRLGVAVKLVNPDGVQTLKPETYTEEYGLPVFHLSFDGTLTAGGYRPVRLVYRGHRYTLEAKYRGATSSIFPKRNYTLKFAKDDPFHEPDKAGGAFSAARRLVLISPFNDNSYLRPRLAFDLWNRMSTDHIQIKTYSAIMYVNGRFWGLFTVADHVDDDLMERHGLSKEGDLFKAVDADANFSRNTKTGASKQVLSQGFEKKEGTPKDGWVGAYDTLNALTVSIADSNAQGFFEQWGSRLHAADYEDWWIFNTAILGTDSASKNAYHYYDPVSRAPWRFIPWDLDASFGQLWDTRRIAATALPDFTGDNLLFSRMLSDPRISTPLRERYRTLLRGPLSKAQVLALIDGYAEELRAVAPRDEARWRKQYINFERWMDRTDFTTHEQEVAYLRQWVNERWDTLDQRLP